MVGYKNHSLFLNMKPREKLIEYGISNLSDDELIAIILGKGTKKETVFQTSKRLLEQFDHSELINIRKIDDFMKNFNVSYVKSAQLIATFELGKRFFKNKNKNHYFRSSEQVYEYVKEMEHLQKEHVKGLYLDTHYKLIYEETVSIGGLNANILHPREVFQPALEHNAYALIIVHNHPSGDPTPSHEDRKTTNILQSAAEILHIPLLDHIIIGKNCYKSLK
jgi:DNA repair protein RadC